MDEEKDVRGNILDGVPESAAILEEYYHLQSVVKDENFDEEEQVRGIN